MAVFKRANSPKLYFKFRFKGKQYLRSADTTNHKQALKREEEFYQQLVREASTPADQRPLATAPLFKDFVELPTDDSKGGRFWTDYASNEYKNAPRTMEFYTQRIQSLLKFEPLANARLDEIDEVILDRLKGWSAGSGKSNATINRNTATLRLVLNKAKRWKLIRQLPEFEHFEEDKRGRVVTPHQEKIYLAAVEGDQRDFFLLLIDTAIEPGTAASLSWSDVHFGQQGQFKTGYVHGRCQKTKTRERDLPMSTRLAQALKQRWLAAGRPKGGFVFPADRNGSSHPTPLSTFQSVHKRLWLETAERKPLRIPRFRLYDLRHTCLTRLRDSGADAFELKQAAGWSSIRMADVYIHTDDRAKASAYDRLNTHIEAQQAALSKAAR